MNLSFTRYWWIFLLRGVLAVLLGVLALLLPFSTFTTLVLFLGAYMFADGIFSIVAGVRARKHFRYWGWMVTSGIFGIIVGIITFINPFVTAIALMYIIAFWAMVAGIAEIGMAIRLRKVIKGEGWYILAGILSIAFSVFIFINPAIGAITLTIVFGAYALIFGIILLSFALRLRQKHRRPHIEPL